MRTIQGEIGWTDLINDWNNFHLRNEYPDEDSSDDDGSYGGYCDEDGLTSGVRGFKKYCDYTFFLMIELGFIF